MNFRRLPFQFSTTDPLERQKELEKRFGLTSNRKMYVDVANPLSTGSTPRETSSPRLQHRVPIFTEDYDLPVHSSVDSMASIPENKKPNVRMIPIEIEGAESRPSRHRSFSGPAGTFKEHNGVQTLEKSGGSPLKRYIDGLSKPSNIKVTAEPRVYNIPIQVEGASNVAKCPKVDPITNSKSNSLKISGCSTSKSSNISPKKERNILPEINKKVGDQQKITIDTLLKKIDDVLLEFKTYETGVIEFNGTLKDKQYRYLDEMLTRCMLRLDDINTMGNEDVRLARKNAVKKIQTSIDLLESKANITAEVAKIPATPTENIDKNDVNIEMQDNQELKDNKQSLTKNILNCSEIKETDISNNGSEEFSKAVEIELKNKMTLSEEKLDDNVQIEVVQMPSSAVNKEIFEMQDIANINLVDKSEEQNETQELNTNKQNLNKKSIEIETLTLQDNPNFMPEIKMSELSQNMVTNEMQELNSTLYDKEQGKVSGESDVEMQDEKDMNSELTEKASFPSEIKDATNSESIIEKQNIVSKVEMTEKGPSSSKNSNAKMDVDVIELTDNCDHSKSKLTNIQKDKNSTRSDVQVEPNITLKDTEMIDVQNT